MDTLPTDDAFDIRRAFVRVTGTPRPGLVAFEFSLGGPELTVELLLPTAAFDEFCTRHRVERLDD